MVTSTSILLGRENTDGAILNRCWYIFRKNTNVDNPHTRTQIKTLMLKNQHWPKEWNYRRNTFIKTDFRGQAHNQVHIQISWSMYETHAHSSQIHYVANYKDMRGHRAPLISGHVISLMSAGNERGHSVDVCEHHSETCTSDTLSTVNVNAKLEKLWRQGFSNRVPQMINLWLITWPVTVLFQV